MLRSESFSHLTANYFVFFLCTLFFGQAEAGTGGKEGNEKCGEKDGATKNIGGGKVKMNLNSLVGDRVL